MNKVFGPRKVESWAPLRWVKCALELMERGIHLWILMVIISGCVAFFLSASSFMTEFILLISLFVGISIASALDYSRKLSLRKMGKIIVAEFKPALYVAFLFIISIYIIFFIKLCLTVNLKGFLLLLYYPIHFQTFTLVGVFDPSSKHLIFVLLLLMITGWFIYPLTLLQSRGIYSGLALSLKSLELNFLPLCLFSIIIIAPVNLIKETQMTIFYPFCNIFASAYIYVAYRDIFLGETNNKVLVAEENRQSLVTLAPAVQK